MSEPTPDPTPAPRTPADWFDTLMRAATPALLGYLATFGSIDGGSAKDKFTHVVDAALADGDYDLARRLIDAVDPPKGAK